MYVVGWALGTLNIRPMFCRGDRVVSLTGVPTGKIAGGVSGSDIGPTVAGVALSVRAIWMTGCQVMSGCAVYGVWLLVRYHVGSR